MAPITPDISDWSWRVAYFAAGTDYVDAVTAVARRAADLSNQVVVAADELREAHIGDQAEIDRKAREALAERPSVPLDDEGRPTLFPSPWVRGSERPRWQTDWRAKRQAFSGDLEALNQWEAETPIMEQRPG
jgi:hypothetical protein